MRKSYKFRIYPNRRQERRLIQTLHGLRLLYNAALEQRRLAWRYNKKNLTVYEQINELPELRRAFPEYREIYAQVLQDVLKRVDNAFKLFFRRLKNRNGKAGYPRYKNESRYDSFTYPQAYNGSVKFQGNRVWLSKIGSIRIKMHRQIQGNVKTVTVKHEGNHWYVIVSCDNIPKILLPPSNKKVGIDLGLINYATLSDGTTIENPRHLKRSLTKLKDAQRQLSKKTKGTSAYRKVKERVAKIHRKITNQRRDFLHKLSRKLINEYGTIVIENLEVKRLLQLKNGCRKQTKALHREINAAGWSMFVSFLLYKAEEAGRRIIQVDPAGTTRTCSRCGYMYPDHLPLSQRVFKCPKCGLKIDRDYNAAINILHKGLGQSLAAIELQKSA